MLDFRIDLPFLVNIGRVLGLIHLLGDYPNTKLKQKYYTVGKRSISISSISGIIFPGNKNVTLKCTLFEKLAKIIVYSERNLFFLYFPLRNVVLQKLGVLIHFFIL